MIVAMTESIASPTFAVHAGQYYETDDAEAQRLIGRGLAVPVPKGETIPPHKVKRAPIPEALPVVDPKIVQAQRDLKSDDPLRRRLAALELELLLQSEARKP